MSVGKKIIDHVVEILNDRDERVHDGNIVNAIMRLTDEDIKDIIENKKKPSIKTAF